jgi:trehalose/maltose hydrolase-like predicted phosphorylase
MATAAVLRIDGRDQAPLDGHSWLWRWKSMPGQVAFLERLVALARCDDLGRDPGASVVSGALENARQLGRIGIIQRHQAAWDERWRCSHVEVEGDASAQRALRFAIYHLNSAGNPEDEHVSVGARALTGEDYHGHVFWDTEIYLLPFYTLTWPAAARALLMYRYHGLAAARAKAALMGWKGAYYAWESVSTGEEATPTEVVRGDGTVVKIVCGQEEQHISADVAYAVWHYWQATGDDGFLQDAGAEVLFETARFWASRAQPEIDGKRHIRGVEGPDEYHEHIDDSAFTNVMARWNIRRAVEVAALLRTAWPARWAEIAARLGLTDTELMDWTAAADTLVIGYDSRTGLFEQFSGFFKLDPIDLAQYASRATAMDVVLGREQTQRSQVVKQADIVALIALLPEEFDQAGRLANFRFYEPLCDHGSSLSRAMHAQVAAQLGDTDLALRYFREAASIDLADTAWRSAGGVHIATLGGLWQAAVFGFAGLTLLRDAIALDPHLPAGWGSLGFSIQWRGRTLKVRVEQQGEVSATLQDGDSMKLIVDGKSYELVRGTSLNVGSEVPA